MRLSDGLAVMRGGGPQRRATWWWFPWAIVASLGFVVVVNGVMVWFALGTFPGAAGSDGFDLSNHYDRVLANVEREAALGWKLHVLPSDGSHPVVVVTDRAGVALHDARIGGVAERPLGPPETTNLTFHEAAAGRYVADVALSMPGQWELQLSVNADGHAIAATRRIVIGAPTQRGIGHDDKPSAG